MDSDLLGDIANIVWRAAIVIGLIASAVRSGTLTDCITRAAWPIRYGIHLTWLGLAGAGIAGISLLVQIPTARIHNEARWFFLLMGVIVLQIAIITRVQYLRGRLHMRKLPVAVLAAFAALMAALPLTALYLDLFVGSEVAALAVCYGPLALYFVVALTLPRRARW